MAECWGQGKDEFSPNEVTYVMLAALDGQAAKHGNTQERHLMVALEDFQTMAETVGLPETWRGRRGSLLVGETGGEQRSWLQAKRVRHERMSDRRPWQTLYEREGDQSASESLAG